MFVVTTNTNLSPTACPSGFQKIEDFCFAKNNEEKTFTEATSACQQLGGYLVEPRSGNISTAVRAFDFQSDHMWIGLRDTAQNQYVYLWQTDNAALSYTDWDSHGSQPNNAGGNQHCAALNFNHRWDDIACELKHEYLCQVHQGE